MPNDDRLNTVIVTGMSGAGRTETMHVFEELGYYCVDNVPTNLLLELIEMEDFPGQDEGSRKLAMGCDARNSEHFGSLSDVLADLRKRDIPYTLVFLDADDVKLVARYKSSRRRHPLCTEGTTIAQGIQRERHILLDLKSDADYMINTTDMMPQDLRNRLRSIFETGNERKGLAVTVYSFGFKHGAPTDADLVMDVRFLPNPFYDPQLRTMTGLDAPVRDFVILRDETIEFNKKWQSLLDLLMVGYVKEGKQQLAIGMGCTGGQHRSVALAEATGDYLKSKGYRVSVAHRDLSRAIRDKPVDVLEESPDVHSH